MEEKMLKEQGEIAETPVDVYVTCIPGEGINAVEERMKICRELWECGISAEFEYKANTSLKKQLDTANLKRVPYVVVLGPNELATNKVGLKIMGGEVGEREQMTVSRSELPGLLLARIQPEKAAPTVVAEPMKVEDVESSSGDASTASAVTVESGTTW